MGGNINAHSHKPPLDMPFKFDSESFFLTYPRADIANDDLYNFLASVTDIEWARICREQHADGGFHSHAVGRFRERFQTRQARIFDYEGHHPNIKSTRSIRSALAYVAKDGDYKDYGNVPQPGASTKRTKRPFEQVVAAAKGSQMEWLQCVYEENLQKHFCDDIRRAVQSMSVDLDEYDGRTIGEALSSVPTEFTSMLVVGKPGIGKTGWAMLHMPRPVLLVKHVDTLRYFRPGYHQSILFDDFDAKHFPRATQLQLCDYENQCQIHARYGVSIIPRNVKRLFLCNYNEEPFIQDEAIQGRRLTVIYL